MELSKFGLIIQSKVREFEIQQHTDDELVIVKLSKPLLKFETGLEEEQIKESITIQIL